MKRILFYTIVVALLGNAACTDMLMEENKVKVMTDYIYETPDGIDRAAVALHERDRSIVLQDETSLFAQLQCDGCTDLLVFYGGGTAALNRLVNFNEGNALVSAFWDNRYVIIGKANEVIDAAENKLGLDHSDSRVKQAWGEAKLFRARCYFDLFRRFDRLYINTRSTHLGNIDRIFVPASTAKVFELINADLDDAIEALEWTSPQRGRMTKAVAKHVKAQVALWLEDWDEAITQCEDIFRDSQHVMATNAIDCFEGADALDKEVILALQFSANIGGGNSVSAGTVTGHRLSLNTTPRYDLVPGMTFTSENGGYGWGRFFPNTYLFSLYDREKDTRFENLFKKQWFYNDESVAGITLGEAATTTPATFLNQLHPCSRKYFDSWTNTDMPNRTSSYKDIVIYRLAETALIAAEAYMRRDGGGSAEALANYNKTWERAGNDPRTEAITIDDIVDEYARELHFEGTRWYLLKRLGILEARVRQHYGDTRVEDPRLGADYIEARNNMSDKYTSWPIPLSALDQMGRENFPQNSGW